jgi:hypothetical protein
MQEATDERERNDGHILSFDIQNSTTHYMDHCSCTKYITVNWIWCYLLVQVSKWAMALISSLILQVGFRPWDDPLELMQCHIMQDSTYSRRGCLHFWTESEKHLDLLLYWDLVGDGGLDVQYRLHRLKSFSSSKILIEGTWLLIISVSVSSRHLYMDLDWRQRCSWRTVSACKRMKRMMKSKTQTCTLSRFSIKTEKFRGPGNSEASVPCPIPIKRYKFSLHSTIFLFFKLSDGWRWWDLTWVSESTIQHVRSLSHSSSAKCWKISFFFLKLLEDQIVHAGIVTLSPFLDGPFLLRPKRAHCTFSVQTCFLNVKGLSWVGVRD